MNVVKPAFVAKALKHLAPDDFEKPARPGDADSEDAAIERLGLGDSDAQEVDMGESDPADSGPSESDDGRSDGCTRVDSKFDSAGSDDDRSDASGADRGASEEQQEVAELKNVHMQLSQAQLIDPADPNDSDYNPSTDEESDQDEADRNASAKSLFGEHQGCP